MSFYNFFEALPAANYMAVKANRKIESLETDYYSNLGLKIVEEIHSKVEQGSRCVDICLNLDSDKLGAININIKKIKKAWRYYSIFSIKYKKLNCREKAIYKVLMDLTNKGYFASLFSKKIIEGDGIRYEYTYYLPYLNIVW